MFEIEVRRNNNPNFGHSWANLCNKIKIKTFPPVPSFLPHTSSTLTECRVLARPGGSCTVNLRWCWSALVNLTPYADSGMQCVFIWVLSDQAKYHSEFNSCLALSCREGSFFFLVSPHWLVVGGHRHQKPSALHKMVWFNQSLTKRYCLDSMPKVKKKKYKMDFEFKALCCKVYHLSMSRLVFLILHLHIHAWCFDSGELVWSHQFCFCFS